MQASALLRSGGYHISAFTCMVDGAFCRLTMNL
jgi:hypothetical protein